MSYEIRNTRKKAEARYKSIYLSEELNIRLETIAYQAHTSFNNVIMSMVQYCLQEKECEDYLQARPQEETSICKSVCQEDLPLI